jgi:hypothetical protein
MKTGAILYVAGGLAVASSSMMTQDAAEYIDSSRLGHCYLFSEIKQGLESILQALLFPWQS